MEKAGQNGNSKDTEKRSWKNTVEVIEIQRCGMSCAARFHPCRHSFTTVQIRQGSGIQGPQPER